MEEEITTQPKQATVDQMQEGITLGIENALKNLNIPRNEVFHLTAPNGVTIELKSVEKSLEELQAMALNTYNKLNNGGGKRKEIPGIS